MPLFLIKKLLLLKILIVNVVAYGYEYGYHPSAEEFDNLMRETSRSRTWTRNLLGSEKRYSWNTPSPKRRSDFLSLSGSTYTRPSERFVPKFKYEKERYPYESTLNLKWPGYAEKILRKPRPMNYDQQNAPSTNPINAAHAQNIGSNLDFQLFSDEINIGHNHNPSKPINNDHTFLGYNTEKTSTRNQNPFSTIPISITQKKVSTTRKTPYVKPLQVKPTKNINGTVIEMDTNSSERIQAPVDVSRWQHKYSLNNLNKNNSEVHFPIYFTNPVTGIVYAISEIGRIYQNLTQVQRPKDNSTISIYITKEQYDRDTFLLRQQYEKTCSFNTTNNKKLHATVVASTLSDSLTSSQRPQVIRPQKPLTISKLPINLNHRKPPSVMVQSEAVIVNNKVQLPPPKRPHKLRNKKKRKKKKKPGRKSTDPPYQIPSILKGGVQPQIILSTRSTTLRPAINGETLKSQLERPNLPTTTVFDTHPIAATSGYVQPKKLQIIQQLNDHPNHRLKRRSILSVDENTTAIPPTLNTTQRSYNSSFLHTSFDAKRIASKQAAIHRFPVRRKKRPHLIKNTTMLGFRHRNGTQRKIHKVTKANSTTIRHQIPSTERSLMGRSKNHTSPVSHKRRKTTKRGKNDDSGFDILDLFDDNDDDDDAGDDDDDENENAKDDSDSDYYYDDENSTKHYKHYRKSSNGTRKYDEEDDDEDDESREGNKNTYNDLKEQIAHDNSSSAEEEADFGALEKFDTPAAEQQDPTPELEVVSSETKNTYSKKRIRRRPVSSASYEDFNEEADDDDDSGSIGGFFQMLFYPVQVAMGRIADTFMGTTGDRSDEEIDDKIKYLTYTQYSSATSTVANSDDDDEGQGNSLSSWFSSLFGFNRRTKKISSTTAAPPVAPTTTEAPVGWLESWFSFGNNKSSSTETSDSNEDYDDYDKWFSSWFSTKPKIRRRTSTTSTTTATLPQVPILTIVDPMKNPQNWLGILAHHIINSTTTTMHSPLLEALTRATTTENPDVPHLISYEKYQIWRLRPQKEAHVIALEEYKRTDEGVKLQWLKGPSLRGLTDVLVPPKMTIDFQATLQFESIGHEILIFDVGKAIAYEQTKEQFYLTTPRPHKNQQKQKYASLINMSWNKYYEYDDIVKYLESVRMRHPQIVELFHIGRSYEGRPLVVVKLEMKTPNSASNSGATQPNHKKLRHKKKSGQANAVFIEAGTHGLEWIGPATATWMINELLRVMKSNKTTNEIDFIRNTTWYIMPVLNPDGYVYSHEYDRFWKKSRSRHISRPGGLINSAMTWLQQKKIAEKVCYGVDLDRNWHYQWGKRGSSKSPCNEDFAGPLPFSEPETKALSDFLIDNRKQIKMYISMQAYGQIISYPTKANTTFDTERLDDFMDVAMAGVDGFRKKGKKSRYKIDSANDLIEHRAGCADAFAAYEVDVPFSYTLYLADNGVHGYLLPSSSIESTARDAFEIVISMLDYI